MTGPHDRLTHRRVTGWPDGEPPDSRSPAHPARQDHACPVRTYQAGLPPDTAGRDAVRHPTACGPVAGRPAVPGERLEPAAKGRRKAAAHLNAGCTVSADSCSASGPEPGLELELELEPGPGPGPGQDDRPGPPAACGTTVAACCPDAGFSEPPWAAPQHGRPAGAPCKGGTGEGAPWAGVRAAGRLTGPFGKADWADAPAAASPAMAFAASLAASGAAAAGASARAAPAGEPAGTPPGKALVAPAPAVAPAAAAAATPAPIPEAAAPTAPAAPVPALTPAAGAEAPPAAP